MITSRLGLRNRTREFMETRKLVVGAFITMTDPTVVDIAALAGYDLVIAECEHGGLSVETIAHHVRAARYRDLGIMVRVPHGDSGLIGQLLDVGVEGIEIPHVKTVDEARRAVSAVRYPPDGRRGMYTKGVAAEFGEHGYESTAELIFAINAAIVCNIIIEDAAGVENIDEILRVPGLDLITVGPGDLAASMGVVDEPDHPSLRQAVERVLAACRQAKIPVHLPANAAPRSLDELAAAGVWMLTSGTDALTLLSGMRRDVQTARMITSTKEGTHANHP